MAQKNLFTIFIDALFNREDNAIINGYYGEHLVQRELNLVKLFGRKGEIFIYLKKMEKQQRLMLYLSQLKESLL